MTKSKFLVFALIFMFALTSAVPAQAFVEANQYSNSNAPGFFHGIWHGLLAPYALVAHLFVNDIVMYAVPNVGWFYDLGFLLGVSGSLPIGWIAAIIEIVRYVI